MILSLSNGYSTIRELSQTIRKPTLIQGGAIFSVLPQWLSIHGEHSDFMIIVVGPIHLLFISIKQHITQISAIGTKCGQKIPLGVKHLNLI